MKLSKLALLAAIACGMTAGNAFAGNNTIQQVSCCEACGEVACGCEAIGCDLGCDTGCDSGCCDSGCDSLGCAAGLGDCSLFGGDCCHDDPFTLFGDVGGITVGGWASIGYHTAALPLFNSRPDEVQLHQAWLYAEKAIDTSCGFDIGGRVDYMYGTDSQDTQAFGIGNDHWDNGWDNGNDYGRALPQLYVEAGYGDLSVKAGHFYTIIGYEVVTAPDNFFYSHAYTMYNSEPFTHTGVMATYNATDDVTVYGGYVLGWDSGFEDNGDAFLGGVSASLTDSLNLTYATVGGIFAQNRFGSDVVTPIGTATNIGGDERGYMHSLVADYAVNDNLQYIIQSDVLSTENSQDITVRDTFGINQYLIYNINDCWAVGSRFEWWNVQADSIGYGGDNANVGAAAALAAGGYDFTAEDFDVYALTLGLNYRPNANVIVRPEVRWDWIDGSTEWLTATDSFGLEDGDDSQFTFGMDTIFLF